MKHYVAIVCLSLSLLCSFASAASSTLTPEQIEKYPLDGWFTSVRPDYTEIDERVKPLAKDAETPEEVAHIVCEGLKNDIEKARAIFDWICYNIAYDTSYKIRDAANAFKNRKGVCAGYADLYTRMAISVGLDAKTVSGTGYGAGRGGHAWNMVKVLDLEYNERDLLLDSCWGAGYVNSKKFTRSFQPEWFDTYPGVFAFTHYPDNPEDQLIYPAISKTTWNKLTKLRAENYWPYGNKDPVLEYKNRICKNTENVPVTFSTPIQMSDVMTYISTSDLLTEGFFLFQKEVSADNLKKYLSEDEFKSIKFKNSQNGSAAAVSDVPFVLIAKYCNALSQEYGFEEYYIITGDEKNGYKVESDQSKYGFRLPTKQEWLTACGSKYTNKSVSEALFSKVVWYNKNSGGRIWVSGHNFISNATGLYDMLGNVSELCLDEDNGQYVFMGGNVFSTREEIQDLEAVPFDNYVKNKGAHGFRLALDSPKKPQFQAAIANLYNKNTLFYKKSDKYIEWLTLAADNEYPQAISQLSSYYYNLNTEEGLKKAFELALIASEFNDEYALYLVGYMYDKGQFIEQNDKKALEYYERSAEQGNVSCMYAVSQYYKNGLGTEVNDEMYFYWLEKAVSNGYDSEDAKEQLANCYKYGNGCEINDREAFLLWNKLAQKGNVNGMLNVAECYAEGIGTAQNYINAVYYYKKTAALGYVNSIAKLADYYFNGTGIARNIEKAIQNYKILIDEGFTGNDDEYLKKYELFTSVYESLSGYDDHCASFIEKNKEPISECAEILGSLMDEIENLQGVHNMNIKLIEDFSLEMIQNKIIEPMHIINSGGKLWGNALIIVNPYTEQKLDNLQKHAFSNEKFEGIKYYVNGLYYRYDEAFFDHYDKIIILKAQNNSFDTLNAAFSKMKEPLSGCKEVDLMVFGTDFFSTEDSYVNDYVEIAKAAVDRGIKPRIIAFGNKTDVLQDSINRCFSNEYAQKIHVFGTPLDMKGQLACGFRSGNLFIVMISEKVNSKFLLIYLDETGWAPEPTRADTTFIQTGKNLSKMTSIGLNKSGTITKADKMVMHYKVVKEAK